MEGFTPGGKDAKEEFRKVIYDFYEKDGRDFPWRHTSPWGVLVSEVMLQQTQTVRAEAYWTRWMEKWPRPADLARAGLEEALREWSGLGYNRRGKYLWECAKIITESYAGAVPADWEALARLPGLGPYTARAAACFAYDAPLAFIETNIRAVMLHFFFQGRDRVADREITPLLDDVLDRASPRRWNYALMDYGAALKKITRNPNRKSASYARQSPFEGSFRQIRGALVKNLASGGPQSGEDLCSRLGFPAARDEVYRALSALVKESMVAEKEGVYYIGG